MNESGDPAQAVRDELAKVLMRIYPVMVTDDKQEWRTSIVAGLWERGYTAIPAGSGRVTVEIAKAAKPDAYLLDLQLEDETAREVLQELQQVPSTKDAEKLVMTERDPDGVEALAVPVERKSWSITECLDTIERTLLEPLRLKAYARADQMIGDVFVRLRNYEEMFGSVEDYRKLHTLVGRIIDLQPTDFPDTITVTFGDAASGKSLRRTFPGERLRAVEADYLGASVEYSLFTNGSRNISCFRNLGKALPDFLATDGLKLFSDEELSSYESLAARQRITEGGDPG